MVYTSSFIPSMFLHHHHHENEIVDFADADACEKAIFYGIHDEHEGHLSKVLDDCWLCDNHTLPLQSITNSVLTLPEVESYTEFVTYYNGFHSIDLTGNSNKDPPHFI